MRAKLLHHSEEWLPGHFDLPEESSREPHISVWHVQWTDALVSMKTGCGAGIWRTDGKLLRFDRRTSDIRFTGTDGLVIEAVAVFGSCATRPGVGHRVDVRSASDWNLRSSISIVVPTGGPEYLVVSPLADACIVTWLDQRQWGYVGVDLRRGEQTPLALEWPAASLTIPDYTTDGRYIIACHPERHRWWTADKEDDDDWHTPSPGGNLKFGTVSVQDVRSGETSMHELFVELERGWIPENPEEVDWSGPWGPECLSPDSFKLWLPDNSEMIMKLPLPPQVLVGGLSRIRVQG